MSDSVILVENIGKKYIIGHQKQERYTALRDVITEKFKSFGRKLLSPVSEVIENQDEFEEFWALKDVSFEVKQGDRVGIIGRNGAGKSTLLKVLSRITEPTEGRISIKGRVASLLEVGTGFHPELTGRENIFLNGAILGMSRGEIKRKFDEIVDFAEVEKFIDTPVKRYSSGMYVRLAFAVAAHLEPEILIVDEVLAVGDAQFQKKCLGKMDDVSKEGRTVLFVSHNIAAIKSLCNRGIWLQGGQIRGIGTTNDVSGEYMKTSTSASSERIWSAQNAPGNENIRWHRVCIRPYSNEETTEPTVATPLVAEFECWNYLDNAKLNFSMILFSMEGVMILNTFSSPKSLPKGLIKGNCHIPGNFLNNQTYRINIMLVEDSSRILHYLEDALVFELHDIEREVDWYGEWQGVVRPKIPWEISFINESY